MFSKVIERLNGLYTNDESDFLISLQEKGFLAGGAMVFALNDWVPPNTVGDLDFFATSIDIANEMIDMICAHFSRDKPPAIERGEYATVWTFSAWGKKLIDVPIQVIYLKNDHPDCHSVLADFDIDAVQCGLFGGEIYQTERCKNAHSNKQVSFVRANFNLTRRLFKLRRKGFKAPIVVIHNEEFEYAFGCHSDWVCPYTAKIALNEDRKLTMEGIEIDAISLYPDEFITSDIHIYSMNGKMYICPLNYIPQR